MSGMFFSLDEAAGKLNKTNDELRQLAKDGKLREFRDGPNILFKVSEIEALMPKEKPAKPAVSKKPVEVEPEIEIPELTEETPDIAAPEEAIIEDEEPIELEPEIEIPELDEEPEEAAAEDITPDEEPADISEPEDEPLELEPEMEIPELAAESSETPAIDDSIAKDESLELEPEQETKSEETEDFMDFDSETAIMEVPEDVTDSDEIPADDSLSSILLAPETGAPVDESDLSSGDTDLIGQGTSVLGLSDNKEYDVTDDTMADTIILDNTKAGSAAEGLDEIEEDVSLDSFGSGSGLLDLSLQADDTSLGGILDEIYTDENSEPAAAAAESEPEIDMSPDHGAAIEEIALTPQMSAGVPLAATPGIPEAAPDSQSNILGMLLFVPIAAVIYTAIVAFSGLNGILPSILTMIQIWIWPIMGALALVSVIVAVAAIMLTGERRAPVAKEKKAKKVKPPKVKKEKIKKPKKEKPPKPDKKAKKK